MSYDEAPYGRPDLPVTLDIYAENARVCSAAAESIAARINTWPGYTAYANLPEFSQHPDDALTA